MWNRKRLLSWSTIRFGQTFGTAHQESRSPGKWTPVQDTRQIDETGNVLSTIQSQGIRRKRASARNFLSWSGSFGKRHQQPEGHFVPEVRSQERTKGQPEGHAVTGITRKPWVEYPGLVSGNSAGQITVTWRCARLRLQTVNGNYSSEWFPLLFYIPLN